MGGVEDGHSAVTVIAVAKCGKRHGLDKLIVLFPVNSAGIEKMASYEYMMVYNVKMAAVLVAVSTMSVSVIVAQKQPRHLHFQGKILGFGNPHLTLKKSPIIQKCKQEKEMINLRNSRLIAAIRCLSKKSLDSIEQTIRQPT